MVTVIETATQKIHEVEPPKIPDILIYEMAHGQTIYYRGYQECLNGSKPPEAIMGSGYRQGFLVVKIITCLAKQLPDAYQMLTNEFGVFYQQDDWRLLDICIYHKDDLKAVPLEDKYLRIPPRVVIEVDTKADFGAYTTPMDYIYEKTEDLLNFGVERVIWTFTKTRRTMVAVPNEKWTISPWKEPIPIIENIQLVMEDLMTL